MSHSSTRTPPPLVRVKDFRPWREAAQWSAIAGVFAISIANGFWDGLALGTLVLVIALGKLAKRIEWRGSALLPAPLAEPADQGWFGPTRDPLMLILIIVALPVTSLTVAIVYNSVAAWIGAGIGTVVTVWASISLLLEIRRRQRERGPGPR